MSSALFSNSWYRVAMLRPRLRSQARVLRHIYRGERWHVLQDRASGRFLRLNAAAYGVVAMFDGRRSLADIWKFLCEREGDNAPTQDEIVQLLTQLHQSNVLLTDRPPDLEELDERRRRVYWQKLKQYLANPMSLKIPLYDPDRLLAHLVGSLPRSLLAALPWLWVLLVGSGVAQVMLNWEELTADMAAHAFTPENMLLLLCVFPVLKAIHELGHGLAIKAQGGACHETGLMFLVMAPVPYIDASTATAFADKRQRMLVGAAGMMAETAVAAIAVWFWVSMTPGVGRALLHEVILLAGVTTLVFNLNPLIRFDGYYILADWLEIPNLGQKANQYLGYLVNHHVFGIEEGSPPPLTPGEVPWLLGYAVASFFYRMFIAVAIVLLVATNYFFFGILLALWSAWGMLLQPLWRHARYLVTDAALEGRRQRAIAIVGSAVVAVLLFVGFVPAPDWTMTEGVIWMPETSRVRAPVACFGAEVRVPPGTRVRAGDELLTCSDPELDAQRAQLVERKREIESRVALATTADRVQTQIAYSELTHVDERLVDIDLRREAMTMKSPHDGEFTMVSPGDYPGRYLTRGDVAAYVLDPARYTLLAVVPQAEVDLVRRHTREVELRSVDRIWNLLPAHIVREVPAATSELPSMALSLVGGGKIGLDPTTPSGSEPKALAPLFQFELAFASSAAPKALGNRVHVRFVHYDKPLAAQWYRGVRQLFLKRFAV